MSTEPTSTQEPRTTATTEPAARGRPDPWAAADEDLRELYGAFADRVRDGSVGRLVALTTRPDLLPLAVEKRHDVPYGRLDVPVVVAEP